MNINYRNILHVKFAETAEKDGTGRRFAIPSLPEHTHTHTHTHFWTVNVTIPLKIRIKR